MLDEITLLFRNIKPWIRNCLILYWACVLIIHAGTKVIPCQQKEPQVLLWINSTWSWWRHQMEIFSALLAICVGNSRANDEDVCFDLRLNIRLSKQSWGWWFETPLRPLWRHCNVLVWSNKHWICSTDYIPSRGEQCFHTHGATGARRPVYAYMALLDEKI